ncbi:MAG: response regulator [Proteobacteria bacterium]|nr:response regulator [Pseudomonadota bacterium]
MSTTVLLADCVSAYRSAVASRLEESGFEILEMESSSDVLEAIRKRSFDLVIIDSYLFSGPEADLFMVCREIDETTRLILIVEPSLELDLYKELSEENSISKLVRGPVHPDVIAKHVEELLSQTETPSNSSFAEDQTAQLRSSQYEMDTNAEAHLLAVRRSYQQKLPGELKKLEDTLNQIKKDPSDNKAMQEAYRLSHSLYGTSGTLGFTEISVAAEKIESEVKRIISGGIKDENIWISVFRALELAKTAPERSSLVETTKAQTACIASILLVDDDPETMAEAEVLAHKNLINLVLTTTREEAIEAAQKKKLDGAIIDINLGGKDKSFQLAQELRSLAGLGDLPVAIMSADSSILNRVAATHAGATQFLQKPLTAEELVEAVRYFSTVRTEISSKVLIVDDDEHFRIHISTILQSEGMDVTSLGEPEQILDVIDYVKPDILLLDVVMPKISGFDVCRLLRSTTAWKDVPILFLTAESAPEVRLECFQAGGDDYIEKPVIREELLARIGVRLERIRLFKERADRDGLTDLPNRRAFLDMFKIRIAEGKRYDRPLSLCLIDLDKFKHVNDTYGHLAGDRVLVGLGKLLSSRFRSVDIRGRWGGEEFAVVFYGEDSMTSKAILSRVLQEFRELIFEGDRGEKFHVTFSCGIATFPGDGTTFNDLFRDADEKLYKAKELGRCRIED